MRPDQEQERTAIQTAPENITEFLPWFYGSTSVYELAPGKQPLPPESPDFYRHYYSVGSFPEVIRDPPADQRPVPGLVLRFPGTDFVGPNSFGIQNLDYHPTMHIIIILLLILLVLLIGPGLWVKRVMARYSKPADRYGQTGAETARRLLDALELAGRGGRDQRFRGSLRPDRAGRSAVARQLPGAIADRGHGGGARGRPCAAGRPGISRL